MTPSEFENWLEFYNREPFDDRERFQRPAALVAHAFGRHEMTDLLKWLRHDLPVEPPPEDLEPGELSVADLNTMASLGMRPPKQPRASAPKKES